MLRSRLPAVSFLLLLAGFAPSGFAKNWYVSASSGSDSNEGTSAKPFKTIQKAVTSCSDGDLILVGPGTYKETADSVGAVYNSNGRSATVRSTDGPLVTIIDADGQRRVAKGTNTAHQNDWMDHCLLFDGFTLQNGLHQDTGGVAWTKLRKCIVKGTSLNSKVVLHTVRMDNCLVVGNRALQCLVRNSTAFNCTFSNNGGFDGSGAVFSDSVLANCVVFGNETGSASLVSSSFSATNSFAEVVLPGSNNGVLSESPFVDAAAGVYRLRPESPCVDAGTNELVPTNYDLRGSRRIVNGIVDAGCYEYREPVTWHVDAASGNDSNDGLSWSAAKKSIQSTVDEAIDGDTVLVNDGTYKRVSGNMVLDCHATSGKLLIKSVNGPEKTILDGEGKYRCAKLSASLDGRTADRVATLVGFTITNGLFTNLGGVSHGIVENCVIQDCTTTKCLNAEKTVGGAGGCKLVNCLILGNASLSSDGTAAAGGAYQCDLYNCTVIGNEAVAGAPAGGLYDCKVYNCIVTGNTVGGIAADVAACTLDHCCLTSLKEGEGNIVAFPKFADEAAGDFRLLGSSPCIDAGSDANAVSDSDLWGNARVQGAHVDIGAYEAGPESWLKVEGTDVVYNGGPNALSVTADFPGAEATILYGLSAEGPFTAEAPSFTDAGEHPVWVVATAPGYPAVTNAATLTVRKKRIDPSMMCVVPDQVWDGTPKTPEVHIRDGWPDILGAENYDVEYVDNVDVGTAGVRVTGKNNYEGTFVYPFGIDPVDETRFLVVDLSGGTNATSYPVSYLSDVPAGGWTEEYKTTKLVLRNVPEGSFWMGSPEDELGRQDNETLHRVTLSRGFYAGVFEVTQKQWELVMGTNVAQNLGGTHPIETVSYDMIRGDDAGTNFPASSAVDASSFLGVLRAKTGLDGFDLPTEAQWEYACRAGTESSLNSGKNLESAEGYSANLAELGRYVDNRGNDHHAAVGSYLPNRWGLFDMHGNVYEWCLDWYAELDGGPAVNPAGAGSGTHRSRRGGGWKFAANRCRSAFRIQDGASTKYSDVGFRLVCEDPEPAETVWYVDAERGDDENTGRSWDDALRTIQNAADRTVAGNTVLVTNGVYEPFVARNKDIVIRSVEGAEKTIVDGGGTNRCATLGAERTDAVKTTLVGFTLRNGRNDHGAGVRGGILEACIVTGNYAGKDDDPSFRGYGGGLQCSIAFRCIVSNNVSSAGGGGAMNSRLEDCLIADNLANNIVAATTGGGLGSCDAVRCTIVDNRAVYGSSSKPGGGGCDFCTLESCIVYGNAYTSGAANDIYNSTATYSCFGSAVSGSGNIDADPLFVDAANGDYRLTAGSPCIDAGGLTTEAKLGTDLDGHSRWIGVGTDMGCYEWATHYAAATQYVAQATGDDANDGLSWETAKATIQNAIDWAADGDEIVVADGVYTGDAQASSSIVNWKSAHLRIRSANGPATTIIDGQGLRRCIQMAAYQPTDPSAYYYETLRGLVTMEGFMFRNGYCSGGGSAVLTATLKNCILTGNVSRKWGAAYEADMENCLIAGNVVWNDDHSGCAPSAAYKCSLANCTVAANTNAISLGACAIGKCVATNCVIVGNFVENVPVGTEVHAATCNVDYSCLDTETVGTSNIVASAADLFFDAANGDYRVRAVAPCVDAGDTSWAAGKTDLAGNPRVAHAAVDMGCYEYGVPATPVIDPPDGTQFANKNSQSVMLTCTDPDAKIYHTVDGSDPATNSATSVKFSILETTTVKAIAVVRGDWASEVATATIVHVYVAQAPDGLAAAQEGAGIALSWDAVETADSYRVCRGTSPDLAAAEELGTTEGLSWTDVTVEPGKTYYYFVVSENLAGRSGAGVPALGSTLGLATAVNMPQLAFTTGDDDPWVPEATEDSADGVHRATSASPGDNGESWIETTVEGPGQIDFRWRASCERDDSGYRDWDHLAFLVDGVEKARLDGRTKWERASFAVEGEGAHTLRWTYAKDSGMADGEDRGFLDCVQWIPEATKGEWEAWIDFHGIGSTSGYEALKPLPSGKGDTLWEEFVAGLNPLDALSRFLADILVPGDEPEISWHPDLGAKRVYTIEGKPFLTNEVWTAPNADSRFFRVWVRMPE